MQLGSGQSTMTAVKRDAGFGRVTKWFPLKAQFMRGAGFLGVRTREGSERRAAGS